MVGKKIIVLYQTNTSTSDGRGGYTDSWSDGIEIKGVLRYVRGGEYFMKVKDVVIGSHLFYCDYNPYITITERDRIVYGTRTFDILKVNNIHENNRRLELMLLEVV